MASSRGILNIQSLNELTSENKPQLRGPAWCEERKHYPAKARLGDIAVGGREHIRKRTTVTTKLAVARARDFDLGGGFHYSGSDP